jgi:cupin domain
VKHKLLLLTALVVLAGAAFAGATLASPPSGVTPTILARGTYGRFFINAKPHSPVRFYGLSLEPMDIVVRQHDYAPGSSTGWHTHPGPVFITVTKGELTYYEADDPGCTPHTVDAGQGFVDTGDGHIVRNLTGAPAQDISVIMAPVGGAFRGELPAPQPNCGF